MVVEADAVDERSIVDALDAITELPAEGWTSRGGRTLSAVGRARLADLAMTLRALRAHSYLSVPELVGEAERLLGLDIEVAARARTSPGRARAQLDAFRDVAVEFARSADHPNLGGFLAWLEAADTRENGLDMPVSEPIPTPCSSSRCTRPRVSSGTSSRSPAWSTAVCRPRRPRARTDRRTRRG